MRYAITLGQLNPAFWDEITIEADRLGYDSVWLPEHLVFPTEIRGELVPGEEHPPVPPDVPVFDAAAYLAFLAGQTARIGLGTFVYLLGIRHPFVSARAFATLDVVSRGRALVGVGAGWLLTEWEAVGLDPSTRGARLDEAIEVCRKLWTEHTVEHHGAHFDFPPVCFEPKPVQAPLPIHVGGESRRALRRAAEVGQGWLGMSHTPESAAAQIDALRSLLDKAGRDPQEVEVTVMATTLEDDALAAYEKVGVDRLVVVPWRRSKEALDELRAFAAGNL